MTGLDSLRGYARRMDELHVWPGGAKLREIADQIERERDAEVADSPYDAILPEDREAIAWVRDHGGMDHMRDEWRSRVPYNRHERERQRLLDHIAECETALGRRNVRIEELGKHIQSLTTENADMRKRLMPEGMEWPRYKDGEMVFVGSDFADGLGETHTVTSVEFFDGCVELHWNPDEPGEFEYLHPGERVKRPAPKVLDADGVEIRVGDTVYDVEDGCELVVTKVTSDTVFVAFEDVEADKYDASQLTHELPDSWERLEEDVTLSVERYRELYEIKENDGMTWPQLVRKDLVRRAKALAERDA